MAGDVAGGVVGDIRAVELADAIVGEARPGADGARARLVVDEAQRQVDSLAVAAVTIV